LEILIEDYEYLYSVLGGGWSTYETRNYLLYSNFISITYSFYRCSREDHGVVLHGWLVVDVIMNNNSEAE